MIHTLTVMRGKKGEKLVKERRKESWVRRKAGSGEKGRNWVWKDERGGVRSWE